MDGTVIIDYESV